MGKYLPFMISGLLEKGLVFTSVELIPMCIDALKAYNAMHAILWHVIID